MISTATSHRPCEACDLSRIGWLDEFMDQFCSVGMNLKFVNVLLYRRTCIDIDGFVQDCSNTIANALELLQSCTKPTICILCAISLSYAADLPPRVSSIRYFCECSYSRLLPLCCFHKRANNMLDTHISPISHWTTITGSSGLWTVGCRAKLFKSTSETAYC